MVSPTDKDVDRLREEHGLDLSEVITQKELETQLRLTDSKGGSQIDPEHQDALRDQLVSQSDKWFKLNTVKTEVEQNIEFDEDIAKQIKRARTPKSLRRLRAQALTEETKSLVDDKIEDQEKTSSDYFSIIRKTSQMDALDDLEDEIESSQLPDKSITSLKKGIDFRREAILEE